MFSTGISKVLSLKNVRHITDTKNPCVLVLTRCHVTDINHVLTPCHVTEINYVDRGKCPSHHRHKKPLRACSDTLSRH